MSEQQRDFLIALASRTFWLTGFSDLEGKFFPAEEFSEYSAEYIRNTILGKGRRLTPWLIDSHKEGSNMRSQIGLEQGLETSVNPEHLVAVTAFPRFDT